MRSYSIIASCLISIISLLISGCGATPQFQSLPKLTESQSKLSKDISQLCELVPKAYAYFQKRERYWPEACQNALNAVQTVDSPQSALAVLETLIDQLHDPHTTLGTNSNHSPRLIPSGSDVWVVSDEKGFKVTAVRPHSAASRSDIRVGDYVRTFNDEPIHTRLRERITAGQEFDSPQRIEWAVNATLAGYRHEPRRLGVDRDDKRIEVDLNAAGDSFSNIPIMVSTISADIKYVRFNNSLGRTQTADIFSSIVAQSKGAKGWIIDLRDTPSGGNTDVAEPILAHFIKPGEPYQRIEPVEKPSYERRVPDISKPMVKTPVIVLVGRWTGSMGEGMAIGFDATNRATVMGSSMAKLAGGTEAFELRETGVRVWLPTYNLAHLNGTPRHEWSPSPNQIADFGDGEDLLLNAAVETLQSSVSIE